MNPLSADAEFRDERSIPLDVFSAQVVEHATATTDEHQQTALAVKVLLVDSHVLGEVADAREVTSFWMARAGPRPVTSLPKAMLHGRIRPPHR